jgi:hypothetical protein
VRPRCWPTCFEHPKREDTPKKDNAATTDVQAIEAVAMDYAEGWYTGNPERMERALHPSLVKRTLMQDDAGHWTVNCTSTFENMVQWTREGEGKAWTGEHVFEVEVLDIFRDVATVRCLSAEYVDYLHLARFGAQGWKIVNVLWQMREGDYQQDV